MKKISRFIPLFSGSVLCLLNILFICLLYMGKLNKSLVYFIFGLSLVISISFVVFCYLKRRSQNLHLKSSIVLTLISVCLSFVLVFTDTSSDSFIIQEKEAVLQLDEVKITPVSEASFLNNSDIKTSDYPYVVDENEFVSENEYLKFNSYLYRVGEYEDHYVFEYLVRIEIEESFIFKKNDSLYISSFHSTLAYPSSFCHLYLNDDLTNSYEPGFIGRDYIRYQFPIKNVTSITANYFFIATETSNVTTKYIHNQNLFYDSLPFGHEEIKHLPINSYHAFSTEPITVPALKL